jgi:membrane protein insertase Oxa1/YidC/SpoIIIJ
MISVENYLLFVAPFLFLAAGLVLYWIGSHGFDKP